MDGTLYRPPGEEINRLPCVFGKALLAQSAVCELARRHSVGEAESLVCASPVARAACGTLYGLLREKSTFALRVKTTERILPHATVMKIQCGGLEGLRQVVSPDTHAPDVHRLVREASERYGGLDALPFSEIIKGVAAFQLRRGRP
ncbi:hypothetical protein RHDC4_00230 [Rhodocyclaceae bacterium]|nr:hypothetical protein RHDC4_00230 [Rhodocyclaceae bacterium]